MNYRHIQVSPIAGAIGAEIAGINLTGNLPEDTIAGVRAALLEHLVILPRIKTAWKTDEDVGAADKGQTDSQTLHAQDARYALMSALCPHAIQPIILARPRHTALLVACCDENVVEDE